MYFSDKFIYTHKYRYVCMEKTGWCNVIWKAVVVLVASIYTEITLNANVYNFWRNCDRTGDPSTTITLCHIEYIESLRSKWFEVRDVYVQLLHERVHYYYSFPISIFLSHFLTVYIVVVVISSNNSNNNSSSSNWILFGEYKTLNTPDLFVDHFY